MSRPLVLASTSRYRKSLLERLGTPFAVASPDVDETPLAGEGPEALVRRLGSAKAQAVHSAQPDSVVIGSDQIATFDGQILGKPGSVARAEAQLAGFSGRDVAFLTAVSVRSPLGEQTHLDLTRVLFRPLDRAEIARYVAAEKPLNCAGSFKAEGLGISLFERIDAHDPTAIIGLPLIWLAAALRREGYRLP
ncbi:MAG: nucleoside triphosphate pyrophosphatase [Gammaproteobacteria bacterium]